MRCAPADPVWGSCSETADMAADTAPIVDSERARQRVVDPPSEVRRLIHDLNNVLTGILGYAELSVTADLEEDSRRQFMVEVLGQARRGVDLLTEFRAGYASTSSAPSFPRSPREARVGGDWLTGKTEIPTTCSSRNCERDQKRILVVDDDPLLLQLMCQTLTAAGYRALAALDAAQGLRLQKNSVQPFDLILTDIHMPGISGLEMIRHMRLHGCGAPVVLTSGHLVLQEVSADSLARECQLLPKPFQAGDLLGIARRCLEELPAGTGKIEAKAPLSS